MPTFNKIYGGHKMTSSVYVTDPYVQNDTTTKYAVDQPANTSLVGCSIAVLEDITCANDAAQDLGFEIQAPSGETLFGSSTQVMINTATTKVAKGYYQEFTFTDAEESLDETNGSENLYYTSDARTINLVLAASNHAVSGGKVAATFHFYPIG